MLSPLTATILGAAAAPPPPAPPPPAPGGGGGSFLVSPNVGLMLWTLVVFSISLYVLSKVVFPRIRESLDKRQAAIDGSIDAAEQTRKEADELLADYRARLKEARSQADDIVARARKAGEAHEAESAQAAKDKREELMEQTRKDVEQETQRAIQQIRNEVADLTILATEKVTRRSLDSDDQRRLVDEALGELDFSKLAGDSSRN